MPVPWRVNDGNFRVPLVISDSYSFPFSDKGDGQTFVYRQRLSYDRGVSSRHVLMSTKRTARGVAYLTYIGEEEDVGEGKREQDLEFSSVPITREEPADVTFTHQITRQVIEGEGEDATIRDELSENTFTMSGFYRYEYFKDVRPDPLISPRYYYIFDTISFVGQRPGATGRIITRDSEIGIYAARIYYRKTPFAVIPTFKPAFASA